MATAGSIERSRLAMPWALEVPNEKAQAYRDTRRDDNGKHGSY